MNYRMSENYEEEILRLNRRVKELLAYSEKAAADNTKLLTENRDLKIHCNKYHVKYHDLRERHFNNQFRIQELEDARDAIRESHQRQKISLNKHLDVIRKQNERIKQLEYAMKSQAIRTAPPSSITLRGDRRTSVVDVEALAMENERLRKECHELRDQLNESLNIIDDLEFELETLDFVEADRDHLQQELKDAREALALLRSSGDSAELFNRFSGSLTVTSSEEDDNSNSGERSEEAPPEAAMVGFAVADSSAHEGPAFASFAVAVDDDEDGEEDAPKQKPPLPPRGKLVEEAAARSNEWKLRRQELHKRLEVLHQRQQFDV